MKRAVALLALSLASCKVGGPAEPPAAHPAAPATTAAAVKAPPRPAAPPPASVAATPGLASSLPASDRIFTLDTGPGGTAVLGTDDDQVWLAAAPKDGKAEVRWTRKGPGVAQEVAYGDFGQGPHVYVAWGVGRGHLDAPLVLEALDPKTGAATELWRNAGERNECAHLSIADVDRDGKPDLAFAYYSSKYFVKARNIKANGQLVEGPEVRMATSRAYADLDGDGKADEIVGRVYGDDKNVPGDLKVDFGKGPVQVPTENGVRSLVVAALGGEARPSLYFCDGWVANYGKEAHARVKRARWADGKLTVETVGASPDEFTFFSLRTLDLDGDGKPELIGQGDKRVTAFQPGAAGDWPARPLATIEPVLNTAVGTDADGKPVLYVPARPNTRIIPLH